MKNYSIPLILLTFLFSIWGCSNMGNNHEVPNGSRLNDHLVKQLICEFFNTDSSGVEIMGIREIPSENRAIVEFNIKNYTYTNVIYGTKEFHQYSGNATATFNHYNEGFWVMENISLGNGLGWNCNIIRKNNFYDTTNLAIVEP